MTRDWAPEFTVRLEDVCLHTQDGYYYAMAPRADLVCRATGGGDKWVPVGLHIIGRRSDGKEIEVSHLFYGDLAATIAKLVNYERGAIAEAAAAHWASGEEHPEPAGIRYDRRIGGSSAGRAP